MLYLVESTEDSRETTLLYTQEYPITLTDCDLCLKSAECQGSMILFTYIEAVCIGKFFTELFIG